MGSILDLGELLAIKDVLGWMVQFAFRSERDAVTGSPLLSTKDCCSCDLAPLVDTVLASRVGTIPCHNPCRNPMPPSKAIPTKW